MCRPYSSSASCHAAPPALKRVGNQRGFGVVCPDGVGLGSYPGAVGAAEVRGCVQGTLLPPPPAPGGVEEKPPLSWKAAPALALPAACIMLQKSAVNRLIIRAKQGGDSLQMSNPPPPAAAASRNSGPGGRAPVSLGGCPSWATSRPWGALCKLGRTWEGYRVGFRAGFGCS